MCCEGARVAIFGAGDHTEWLYRTLGPRPGPDIVAIWSSWPVPGGVRYGLPVTKVPDVIPEDIDAVIISSYDSQEEMSAIIGPKAQRLYDKTVAYDTYRKNE